MYTPETSCVKGSSGHIMNMKIKQLSNHRVWDFATASWVRKLFGTFEKRVPDPFNICATLHSATDDDYHYFIHGFIFLPRVLPVRHFLIREALQNMHLNTNRSWWSKNWNSTVAIFDRQFLNNQSDCKIAKSQKLGFTNCCKTTYSCYKIRLLN